MGINAGKRTKYKARSEKGLCIYCGVNRPIPNRKGCLSCLEKHSAETTEWERIHREKKHQYRLRIKNDLISKYGGVCACCGESQLLFLSIDHKNNDGALEMIRTYGKKKAPSLSWYVKLLQEPIRDDLQVLCFNCNFGKHVNCGVCPHKKVIRKLLPFVDERFKSHFDLNTKIEWPENNKLVDMCNQTSTTEVARKLGVTFGTVRTRLVRRGLYSQVIKRQGNRTKRNNKCGKNEGSKPS